MVRNIICLWSLSLFTLIVSGLGDYLTSCAYTANYYLYSCINAVKKKIIIKFLKTIFFLPFSVFFLGLRSEIPFDSEFLFGVKFRQLKSR